jgi:hydrogenase/urease accessory protein HupE
MMDKLMRRLLPQVIGFFIMALGWYVSIVNVGLDKFTAPSIFTKSSMVGFLLILIGAYLPQIWIAILNKFNK